MYFKNLMIYSLAHYVTWGQLNDTLGGQIFKPCGKLEPQRQGFWPPLGGLGDELVRGVNSCAVFCLRTQSRLLPSDVVTAATEEKVRALGRPLGRKERADIKDQVRFELLPKAFVQDRYTFAYIDLANDTLVIDTSSPSVAEAVIGHLREALGTLKCTRLTTANDPGQWITALGATETAEEGASFLAGLDYVYRGSAGEKVQTKGCELGLGWAVRQLRLHYRDLMSFTLDGGLTFRRVSFSDSAADKVADPWVEEYEHAFDASFCVTAGAVRLMLADLYKCLGGPVAVEE